jgi:hypothetical protein
MSTVVWKRLCVDTFPEQLGSYGPGTGVARHTTKSMQGLKCLFRLARMFIDNYETYSMHLAMNIHRNEAIWRSFPIKSDVLSWQADRKKSLKNCWVSFLSLLNNANDWDGEGPGTILAGSWEMHLVGKYLPQTDLLSVAHEAAAPWKLN